MKLAVFEGSKKTVFKERKEFSGSLLEQIEETYGYMEHYNRTRAEFKGLDRIDRKDYPVEAYGTGVAKIIECLVIKEGIGKFVKYRLEE